MGGPRELGLPHLELELVAWVIGPVVGAAREPKGITLAVDDGGVLSSSAVDQGGGDSGGGGVRRDGQQLLGRLFAAKSGLGFQRRGLDLSEGDRLGDDVFEELKIVLVGDGIGCVMRDSLVRLERHEQVL